MSNSQKQAIALSPFGIALIVIGLGVTLAGWWYYSESIGSMVWPAAKAEIVTVEMKKYSYTTSHHIHPSVFSHYYYHYAPVIHYHFNVNGKDYEGSKELDERGETSAYDFVDKNPKGTPMEVYYNPDMPIESVVDRGVGKQANLYLIE